jgi:integrase
MPKATEYFDTWKHGFVRVDQKGRRTYYIREMRGGTRIKVSTKAHTLEGATAAYELWSKAPADFEAKALLEVPPSKAPEVVLSRALIDEFLAWSRTKGSKGQGNTAGHVANQGLAMDFWLKHLGRRDLRNLKLERDILRPLRGRPQQVNRRRTLKTFYAWLRSEDGGNRIRLADDPVVGALKVPKTNPTSRETPDKAVPWEDLLAVRDALTGHWRATFTVQLNTGWHISELVRFATAGRIEKYTGPQDGGVAVLVCPLHKSGGEHRTVVNAEVKSAAKEMLAYRYNSKLTPAQREAILAVTGGNNSALARKFGVSETAIRKIRRGDADERPRRRTGSFSSKRYSAEVARVATEIGVSVFTAGRLRHSVATHLVNIGADLPSVSTFLGHRSMDTTRRFYATHAVPLNPALMLSTAGAKPKPGKSGSKRRSTRVKVRG